MIKLVEKVVLERYAYYLELLEKIANTDLLTTPTIESLGIKGSVVQKAYKEIRAEDYDVNIIDYLCLMSFYYLLLQVNPAQTDLDAKQIAERILKSERRNDVRNFLRLFVKNPYYLFDRLSDKRKFTKEAFAMLSGEWFRLVSQEWSKANRKR